MKPMVRARKKSSASDTSTRARGSQGRSQPRFVVCIYNAEHPASLELHKIYRVVPGKPPAREEDVRIIDESGEDYLYPAEWFVPVELPRQVESSVLRAS